MSWTTNHKSEHVSTRQSNSPRGGSGAEIICKYLCTCSIGLLWEIDINREMKTGTKHLRKVIGENMPTLCTFGYDCCELSLINLDIYNFSDSFFMPSVTSED